LGRIIGPGTANTSPEKKLKTCYFIERDTVLAAKKPRHGKVTKEKKGE